MESEVEEEINHEFVGNESDEHRGVGQVENGGDLLVAAAGVLHQIVENERVLREFVKHVVNLPVRYIFVGFGGAFGKAP